MSIKLYAQLSGIRPHKILIAANYAGIQVEHTVTKVNQAKKPEYLARNPNGKLPFIDTPNGPVYESNAILRYIARNSTSNNLYGVDNYENTLVDQWLDWCSFELEPALNDIMYPILGYVEYNQEKTTKGWENLKKALQILDDHLKYNTFVVGHQVTIADIGIVTPLFHAFRLFITQDYLQSYKSVVRLVQTLTFQSHFKQVLGQLQITQSQYQAYTGPLQQQQPQQQQQQQQKSQSKPAAQKTQAPPKQKEQQPKQETVKEEEQQQQQQPQEQEKKKNPLDLLPASPFDLYNFKTYFVNHENKKEACQELFKQFDPNGFSFWYIQYEKAEGEGKVLFMTVNLKNGTVQRLEHFRKYALGIYGVYGEEPNLEIRGVMLWRGNEIPEEIRDLPNYEYHKWTRLDIQNESDRKRIEEYLLGTEEDASVVEGLRARDVEYFK